MILFSAKPIFASNTSKSGIETPREDDEDLSSSSESTNSTSSNHYIASVGNCEQVHTSVLNLIFQQAKVAGVGNLSKWRSEICSRCWSAPHFFEEFPPLKLTVQTCISDLDFVLALHFSPLETREAAPQLLSPMDSILEDKELMKMHVALQKHFPMYHVYPKCMVALLCCAAIRRKASTSHKVSNEERHWSAGNVGNFHCELVQRPESP